MNSNSRIFSRISTNHTAYVAMLPAHNPIANGSDLTSIPRCDQKRPRRKQLNPRSPSSCKPCRTSKVRCDRQTPCSACTRRNNTSQCIYSSQSKERVDFNRAARTTAQLSSKQHAGHSRPCFGESTAASLEEIGESTSCSAQSDRADYAQDTWDNLWQRPDLEQQALAPCASTNLSLACLTKLSSAEELISLLPPVECCDYLLVQYFTIVAPMFNVLHEDTFQRRYAAFSRQSRSTDLPWIALVLLICSLSVNGLENNDPLLQKMHEHLQCANDKLTIATELRDTAMACLNADNFMFRHDLTTLESVILMTYGICHDSGVDAAWTMLGIALNMSIALKCNILNKACDNDSERRRRCWIAILSLHTYQSMLFRDVDLRSLLRTLPSAPRDTEESLPRNTRAERSTGALIMEIKIKLCRLASRICHKDVSDLHSEGDNLELLDAEISQEREMWSAQFLNGGAPSVLDATSYAHWCMFEIYAHQLYLHLHRLPRRSQLADEARQRRPFSKWRCVTSGAALLELNQKFLELPRLRHHRWIMFGLNAACTVHGALALASCLLSGDEDSIDLTPYRQIFDAAVHRIGLVQCQSPIYRKAHPILQHIQRIFSAQQDEMGVSGIINFGTSFNTWMDSIQVFDTATIDWEFWDHTITSELDGRQPPSTQQPFASSDLIRSTFD